MPFGVELEQITMDRTLMAKLYEVTSDDDAKAPEDVLKAIVKGTVKASVKDAALQDMAQWLGKRLATDHCGAKIKVLRLIMMIISNPKGGRFAAAVNSEALDVIRTTASFSCPPDPVHGDKPAEFVRASAAKCLDLLGAGRAASSPGTKPSKARPGLQVSTDGGSSSPVPSPGASPGRTSSGSSSRSPVSVRGAPAVSPSAVSKDFAQAIQIDLDGRDAMKLPLGGAMEEELETRQKKLYLYDVKPEDKVVDFEFTVVSPGDLPIGIFFTRKGGDVSYPLEGWAMSKYDLKDGTKRGCCEIAHEGSIALVLDNSSSRMKAKTVKFAVQSRATTEQYEVDKKLADMKAAQERRAAAAREEKLGLQTAGSGGASAAGGPPKPRAPKPSKPKPPTKPKPVSSAAAAAAAYEAAEAEAEAAALFRGSGAEDLPSPGSPGSAGIKRGGKKKRPARPSAKTPSPASAAAGDGAAMTLDFIADAEAARKEQAVQAAAMRKSKQDAAVKAKKEVQKEEMKRKAAAKAKARESAKAQAEEKAKKVAAEAERDRKEEVRFQKQKQAQEQARKAREEMEAEAQAALERARAAAEERRQAQAKAREEVEREKEAKKAARLLAAETTRKEAAEKKAEEKAAREELRKKREAEEAMKIEMYDPSGKVMRRLGRYTVQEENGYVRGWTCDVCLQIKAGTFYFALETVQGEEDSFRACARCLVDGDVIDATDDLEFGAVGGPIGEIRAADAACSSDDEAEADAERQEAAGGEAAVAAAKLQAKNRAIWAGEAVDCTEVGAMSMTATLAEAAAEKHSAKDDSLMTVYIRPGQWVGGSIGDGGKWVQDERFAVRVPRTATWSELVTAVAASDEARDYSVTGGELDGAAEVPLDGAHPELAAINFFTGKTKKRIVSEAEYANFPVPFPGQKAEVARYGVLTRSQVIAGNAAMGYVRAVALCIHT